MNKPIMPETVKEFMQGVIVLVLSTELLYWVIRPLIEHFVSSR